MINRRFRILKNCRRHLRRIKQTLCSIRQAVNDFLLRRICSVDGINKIMESFVSILLDFQNSFLILSCLLSLLIVLIVLILRERKFTYTKQQNNQDSCMNLNFIVSERDKNTTSQIQNFDGIFINDYIIIIRKIVGILKINKYLLNPWNKRFKCFE